MPYNINIERLMGDDNVFEFLANCTKTKKQARIMFVEQLVNRVIDDSKKLYNAELVDTAYVGCTEEILNVKNYKFEEMYTVYPFELNKINVLDNHLNFVGLLQEKIVSFEVIQNIIFENFYEWYFKNVNPDTKIDRIWSIGNLEQIPRDFVSSFRILLNVIFLVLEELKFYVVVENLEKYFLGSLAVPVKIMSDVVLYYPHLVCSAKDYRMILSIPKFNKEVNFINIDIENIDKKIIVLFFKEILNFATRNKIVVDGKELLEIIESNVLNIKSKLTLDAVLAREIGAVASYFIKWFIHNSITPKFYLERLENLKYQELVNRVSKKELHPVSNEIKELQVIHKIIEARDFKKMWWHEVVLSKKSFINFYKEIYNIDMIDIIFKEEVHQKLVYEDLKKRLVNLDVLLKERVFGQDHAFAPIVSVIKRWFVGIKSNKPIGSFMFVGNTGIGKTETAKVLADLLFDGNLITVDMSEFQQGIDVGKIIGVAPGYIGYEEGSGLLEKIKANPKCVLLFDEIEKAHPKIFDVFLQMLDEGRLTDNKGNAVSFEEVLIIFTTNHFCKEINDMKMKFKDTTRSDIIKVLSTDGILRKEFLNRFTDIIHYKDLEYPSLVKIFDSKVSKIRKHLGDINIELEFVSNKKPEDQVLLEAIDSSTEIKNFIIKDIDRSLGARELDRIVNTEILDKIIDIYVEAELKNSATNKKNKVAKIKLVDKQLVFELANKERVAKSNSKKPKNKKN